MFIKNNFKVIIFLLIGILLIVSGWLAYQQWFIVPPPHEIVAPITHPPLTQKIVVPPPIIKPTTQLSLQWQPGDKQTYQYLLQAKIKTNIGLAATTPSWQKMDLKVQGTLNMRVFKRVTQGQFIGFQLSPAEVTFSGQSVPQFEALFQTFFVAIFSPDGKPLRFHFPANISSNDQPLVAEIINAVQTIVPSQNKKQWESEEKHNTGHYRAHYTVSDKGVINKQKLLYTSITLQKRNNLHQTSNVSNLTAKIKKSQFEIELSKQKSWLKQFNGYGEVEVYISSTIVSTNSYLIKLMHSNAPLNPNLAIWQAPDDPNEVLAIFAKQQGISKDVLANLEKQNLKKKFAHTNVKELTDNIVLATLNNESPGEMSAHFIQLAEYLRAYPEHTRHILRQLQTSNVPLKASATLISALQTAGTPEAQYVLADMISGAEIVNPAYVFQGVITTTMVSEPLPELVDSLWTQLENAEIDGMSDLSLLVLGAASGNLQKTGESERATEIDQRLFDYLQENTDNKDSNATFDEETVLRSLGNTGRTDLLPTVEPFFNAENPEIRAVAYKSLRHADDTQSREKLVTALREDKELHVRSATLETLVKRPDNKKSVDAVRQQVVNEQNEGLRVEMLRFIGANKTPKVVETLQQQLETETSRHMKKEVYRALFAE
ncbi:HEAT repeat domain-containing protein [Thiotrichales bacterium HSG1]|nr:HEAT repeat domain-containing protein [Thiotrichales bacterium HSG1]